MFMGKVSGPKRILYFKDRLDKIKGKFILSLNDVPEVRELFKDYQMTHRKIRWSVNSKAAHEDHNGNELIIYNF